MCIAYRYGPLDRVWCMRNEAKKFLSESVKYCEEFKAYSQDLGFKTSTLRIHVLSNVKQACIPSTTNSLQWRFEKLKTCRILYVLSFYFCQFYSIFNRSCTAGVLRTNSECPEIDSKTTIWRLKHVHVYVFKIGCFFY